MVRKDIRRKEKTIEVCFSPRLYPERVTTGKHIVVIVDILRATTAMVSAFHHGAAAIIPVTTIEEARVLQKQGYLLAGEQDGKTLDFADFANSPFSFTRENISGKMLVYFTTNGTYALHLAQRQCSGIVIGAFTNLGAVCNWLTGQSLPVVILCAGWKNRFCIEDTLFAGALTGRLIKTKDFVTTCDSAQAAMDLWELARPDPISYAGKASHVQRLNELGAGDSIPFAFQQDLSRSVPLFNGKEIIEIKPKQIIEL